MEKPNLSALQVYWRKNRTFVILVSCLLMPIVFIPFWIIFVLVERNRATTVTPESEVRSAADSSDLSTPTEIVSSVSGLTFFGTLTIVGGCACYLGFDVMGRADGPGGGIAYFFAVLLLVAGIGATIWGLIGFVPRIKALAELR